MNATEMLRGAFGQAHGILDGQLADCSPAVMSKQYAGGTIHPIGSIYAHVMYSEDNIINGLLQGKPPIWQAAGWSAKTGTTLPQAANQTDEWAGLNIDLAKFKDYATAIKQNTDAYVAGLSETDLERRITFFGQEMSVGAALANVLLWHVSNHSGEIAALKGVQGLKGLPF
jgi:uncharacterized damage-inducible protein DinB